MRYFFVALEALLAALFAAYVFADQPSLTLNSETRAELESEGLAGSFVQLSDGVTHYRSVGNADAPLIVLVHGFSISSLMYESYYAPLTAAGYRVIAIDLYGRGFSDRLEIANDRELLVRQVRELLQALEAPQPYHLVGASMGGALVTDIASRYPEEIQSLTLITPVGLSEGVGPPGILKVPVVGDWISRVFGPTLLGKRFLPHLETAPNAGRMRILYEAQTQYRGYYTSILSGSRNFSFAPREEEHKKIAAHGIKTISIWGDVDETVPIDGKDILLNWNPNAEVSVLEGGGHHITYVRPAEILEIMIASLGE